MDIFLKSERREFTSFAYQALPMDWISHGTKINGDTSTTPGDSPLANEDGFFFKQKNIFFYNKKTSWMGIGGKLFAMFFLSKVHFFISAAFIFCFFCGGLKHVFLHLKTHISK